MGVRVRRDIRSWRRRLALATAAALVSASLVGCGGDSGGPPTLIWYQNPDNGGQGKIAQQCADDSDGAYRVEMQVLPNSATGQREQLVRRLAAQDSSIDVMSLDVVYTAEFANAGFLRPFTDSEESEVADGKLDAPMETATWEDKLYAAPFKSNAQLLWYRKAAAQAAGVDPTKPDFTWDAMLEAAESEDKTVAIQGARYEGYVVWVNALVESAGGQLVDDVEAGAKADPTVDSPEGEKAAEIVGTLARSEAAPPDLSVAQEEQARTSFQADDGMFMLNWPYVLAAARTAVEAGSLPQAVVDDIAWARYPRVDAGTPSAPPLGGTNLAIGAYTEHAEEAVDLVQCATSLESSTQYMLAEGEPSTFGAAYDDPKVVEAYPNAPLIRESIDEAGPRPVSPYYVDISSAILSTWHSPASVRSPETAEETDTFMTEALRGERLQ